MFTGFPQFSTIPKWLSLITTHGWYTILMNINGSCHCGKITVESDISSDKGIVKCHCRDCQKHLGNFAPWVVCQKIDTQIMGPIGKYQSSEGVYRLFCTDCGASLAKKPDTGEVIVIAAGIFDQPLQLEVIDEIFTEAKQPWM